MADTPYIIDGITGKRREVTVVPSRVFDAKVIAVIAPPDAPKVPARIGAPEDRVYELEDLIDRIKSALGTAEDGDALVEVAQNAHAAELALAALVQRASDNPTEHLAHALRSVKVGS